MPPKKIDPMDYPRNPYEARKNDALGVPDNEFEDDPSTHPELCSTCGGRGELEDGTVCPECNGMSYFNVVDEGGPQHEATEFDKFMDSTLLKEGRARRVDAKPETDSPLRRIARGYQERPLGKTRMGGRR